MLTPKELRVAIYIRVSTKLQEDRYSLSGQLTELTRYAIAQGWEIIETFKDVESGAKFDKAGLEALLDCVEDGKVDIVLVIEQDRLSRLDAVDWELLKDVLRENKVKIAEPGSIIDLSNDDDEFISDIKNLLARRERRSIKRKMSRGIRQYTREGKLYGRQPDEYIYDAKTKSVAINQERAWIIPFIDNLYLEEGKGLHQIAQRLNKLCTTANGYKWTAAQVLSRLNSKSYHGLLEKTFENGETITVEDVYPALRTKETYERIQYLVKTNRNFKLPAVSYNHPLRRIKITCKHCGRRLSIVKGPVLEDGNFNVYVNHAREYAKPCIVDPHYNAAQILRPLFIAIKDILLDKELAKMYVDLDFEEIDKLNQLESELAAVQKQLQSNAEKLDKLLDLYLDGAWSKDKLDQNKQRIEFESLELKDTSRELKQKIELVKNQQYNYESFLKTISISEEYLAVFDRMNITGEHLPVEMTMLQQEQLVAGIFENAELDGLENILTLNAKSIENVPVSVQIKIDGHNVIAEEKLKEKQYERYLNTQKLLDEQSSPLTFMELKRITGLNAQTIREDEKLFGTYRNLKPGKGSAERKEQIIQIIKDCLAKDPKMPSRLIAEIAYSSQSTILKYKRELNL